MLLTVLGDGREGPCGANAALCPASVAKASTSKSNTSRMRRMVWSSRCVTIQTGTGIAGKSGRTCSTSGVTAATGVLKALNALGLNLTQRNFPILAEKYLVM